jgi:TubC N-terminal docking domain
MNAREVIKFVESAGLELYLDGERLRYRSPQQPDPELLNLIIENKQDIIKALESKTMVPRLPWQLERLVTAAGSGALHIQFTGVPDPSRYVTAWALTYFTSSQRDEAMKHLWEVYGQWQQGTN